MKQRLVGAEGSGHRPIHRDSTPSGISLWKASLFRSTSYASSSWLVPMISMSRPSGDNAPADSPVICTHHQDTWSCARSRTQREDEYQTGKGYAVSDRASKVRTVAHEPGPATVHRQNRRTVFCRFKKLTSLLPVACVRVRRVSKPQRNPKNYEFATLPS
jgi:hypothetical protein